MCNHYIKFVIVGDSNEKVIQIVGEINDKGWTIVNRLYQMQVVHKWWILNGANDTKWMWF